MSLKDAVLEWLEDSEDRERSLEELCLNGCESGLVGSLVYYSDTIKFFEENKSEINELLMEVIDSTGLPPHELFKNWDKDDPLAMETSNQNLLAWFGFEETARIMFDNKDF